MSFIKSRDNQLWNGTHDLLYHAIPGTTGFQLSFFKFWPKFRILLPIWSKRFLQICPKISFLLETFFLTAFLPFSQLFFYNFFPKIFTFLHTSHLVYLIRYPEKYLRFAFLLTFFQIKHHKDMTFFINFGK